MGKNDHTFRNKQESKKQRNQKSWSKNSWPPKYANWSSNLGRILYSIWWVMKWKSHLKVSLDGVTWFQHFGVEKRESRVKSGLPLFLFLGCIRHLTRFRICEHYKKTIRKDNPEKYPASLVPFRNNNWSRMTMTPKSKIQIDRDQKGWSTTWMCCDNQSPVDKFHTFDKHCLQVPSIDILTSSNMTQHAPVSKTYWYKGHQVPTFWNVNVPVYNLTQLCLPHYFHSQARTHKRHWQELQRDQMESPISPTGKTIDPWWYCC
jgi:hypothetical protein